MMEKIEIATIKDWCCVLLHYRDNKNRALHTFSFSTRRSGLLNMHALFLRVGQLIKGIGGANLEFEEVYASGNKFWLQPRIRV